MKKEKWTLERLIMMTKKSNIYDDVLWEMMDENINSRTYLHLNCKIHNFNYKVRIDHVFGTHKRGCPLCGNECWSEHKIKEKIIPKLKEMDIEIKSNININLNVKSDITLKCNKCGGEFTSKVVWIKNKKFCCSKCNGSYMEREVKNLLVYYNIKFEEQKKFNGLIGVNNGKLSYDFYLPDLNILIECQGEQHYKPFGFDKDNIKMNKQIEHDSRKREYANINKISLIEINYKENIKEKIEKIIIKA